MAETKKKTEEVVEITAKVPALIENAEGKTVSLDDLLEQMNNAEVGMELTADYLKLEDGEAVKLLFIEMTEMQGQGEKKGQLVPAAKFIGMDKRFKICADKVLVSTCTGIFSSGKTPMMLEVTSVGWKKGPNGEYRDLLITELKPKLAAK